MILPYQDNLHVKYHKIKDFIHELAKLNGRKEKLMEIYFWLITYPYLSQAELRLLTGYSSGTISASLKSLMEVSTVTLRPRQNKTVSEYYLKTPILRMDYTLRSRDLSLVNRICIFMEDLIQRINTLETQIPLNPNDLLLKENLQDFYHYYLWAKKNYTEKENLWVYNPESIEKTQTRMVNPMFSPPFELLEREFIEFFVHQQIFEEMSEKNSLVLGFFITRGNLTISEISKLVPYSIGTVSTCVHYLRFLCLIEKNDGKYGYNLFSFGVGWLNYRRFYHQRMNIWHQEFSQMKMELEHSLHEYHFIPQIGPFLVFLNRLLHTLKNVQKYYSENAPLWKIAHDFTITHPQYYPSTSVDKM